MTKNTLGVGILIITTVLLHSCASRLHPSFAFTSSSKDVYITVKNDSVGLTMRAPGDIRFYMEEVDADKFLRKEWELNRPENILFIGKSEIEPIYSFILVMDSPSLLDHRNYNGIRIHTFERKINGHMFNMIAHGEKSNLRPDDFVFMLDNLSFEQ